MEINQVYKAPSLPKIGRRNINSSLNRGALGSGITAKKSTFSFNKVAPKLTSAKLNTDTDKSKESFNSIKPFKSNLDIVDVLKESNKLLYEIREQLSLDYNERIKEREENLRLAKKRITANKISEKEKKIESRGKSLIGSALNTVIAPAKSIFQRILDFLSIIITGIVLNTAFNWLSKKENQEKLEKFFNFLGDYWKELLVVFGAFKILRLVQKISKIGKGLKSLFNGFKGRGQQPGGNTSPKVPGGGCGPISSCSGEIVTKVVSSVSVLGALATGLLGTGLLAPGIGNPIAVPKPIEVPTTEDRIDKGLQEIDDFPNTIFGKIVNFAYENPALTASAIAAVGLGVGLGGLAFAGGGVAASGSAALPATNNIVNFTRIGIGGGLVAGATSATTAKAKEKGIKIPPDLPENEISEQIVKYFGKTEVQLLKIHKDKNAKLVERIAAERTLIQQYNVNPKNLSPIQSNREKDTGSDLSIKSEPKPEGYSEGGSIFERIKGTVGGIGSGVQDTVKALLAPGEEVIKTSSANLFRPLLKDINDNAGRLWRQFTEATIIQDKNNKKSEKMNLVFRKLLTEFTELFDKEKREIEERKRKARRRQPVDPPGGGSPGLSSSRKSPPTSSGKISNSKNTSSPMSTMRSSGKIPNPKNTSSPTSPSSLRNTNKVTPQISSTPQSVNKMSNKTPLQAVEIVPFPINNSEKQLESNISTPTPTINIQNIKNSPTTMSVGPLVIEKNSGAPSVNVVNLAPKVLDLSKKSTPKPSVTDSDAAPIPSISPFDSNNDFNYTVPETLGILV